MKNRYLFPIIILVCFMFLVGLTIAAWWDSTLAYKRTFTNYNGTIFNFTIINNMNTDFSDIRFVDSATESIEYPYFIQYPVNNKSGVIHLIANSSYYIYYGNSTKTSKSDINSVYPGIKHYYSFDEGTGTVGRDNLGTNITLSNAWVNGKSFSAYSVSGAEHPNANFKLGDIDSAAHTFTVTFWLYRVGDFSATGKCISNGGTSGIGGSGQWEIYCNGDQIGSYLHDGSLKDTLSATINLNTWYFVVYTYNGSIGKLTINGNQVGSLQSSTTFNPDATANTLWFFGRDNGINIANAYFDEFRFYNHSLNSSELSFLNSIVSANYTLGSETSQASPPVVTFNYQIPTDITVSSNVGRNLTISYNITDSDSNGVNASTATLYYKTNSTTSNTSIYTNGSSLSGYLSRTGTNVSSNFTFELQDNQIYPGTYNYNEMLMEQTPHSVQNLNNGGDIIKTRLFNVSNTKSFGFFETNASCNSLTNIYYCNSTYTTGDPASTSNCVVFATMTGTTPLNHSHSIYSGHRVFTFAINTT
jgi:hypothetical protein